MNPRTHLKTPEGSGFTLVEVILSVAILAILAVMAATSLYYPTYLVVTSGNQQLAIHAGTAEIERHLNNFNNPVAHGTFDITGGFVTVVTDPPEPLYDLHADFGGSAGDEAHYLKISTTVGYRDGAETGAVTMVTYRSLEIPPGER